jgi:hypothetical protein
MRIITHLFTLSSITQEKRKQCPSRKPHQNFKVFWFKKEELLIDSLRGGAELKETMRAV